MMKNSSKEQSDLNKNNPGNFNAQLHDESYEAPYLSRRLTSESMIVTGGRETESLNGFWNFAIDQYDTCIRSKWYEEKYADEEGRRLPVDFSFDEWDKIQVPSCWNTQREKFMLYEGPAVYTRTFLYRNRGEKKVLIKFGAANYTAKIFLNAQYMGLHQGGSTPFFIDATEQLQPFNRIIVVVDNTRKREQVPCKNTDWFNYGGIYRDVELFRLPETYIKDAFIHLLPGSGREKVRVELAIVGSAADDTATVSIPELGWKGEVGVRNGRGAAVFDLQPELWSCDRPKLYDVSVSYRGDEIRERIGFREIRVEGTDIWLNGERIFLKGVSIHEESTANGKALTEEEIKENFKLAKEMNCNYVRLAHYPHTEKAARIADEMGILLWEEIPVYWGIAFDHADTYHDAENQLAELVLRDRNRASVIIWSVGNENADTDERLAFMSGLIRKVKELDPSRPVSAACMLDYVHHAMADRLIDHLDVIGVNQYYGWYRPDFNDLIQLFANSRPAKPVIITEFGADAYPGLRGTVDEKGTEDCQQEIYKKQVDALGGIAYVKGCSPWILYDFRCPRRLHVTQNYYNTKGLLSADKTHRKLAFHVMQQFYAGLNERRDDL